MRVAAALRRLPPRPAFLAVAFVAGAFLAAPLLAAGFLPDAVASAYAADPTATPAVAGPPTCSERYPAEGPAGVDLRLGCLIGELVGHYTGSVGEDATPASTYALVVIGLLLAGVLAVWMVGRLIGRAAGRRLAPVRPEEWWLCPTCRSVNGAGVQHCYSCGALRPEGPTLRTDDAPTTAQSFGSSRKRG